MSVNKPSPRFGWNGRTEEKHEHDMDVDWDELDAWMREQFEDLSDLKEIFDISIITNIPAVVYTPSWENEVQVQGILAGTHRPLGMN
jgi:hypothetical protein